MTSSVRGNTPSQPSPSVSYRRAEFIWLSMTNFATVFALWILPGISGSFALLVTPQLFYHLSTVLTSSLSILDDPLPYTFDLVFAALAPGEQMPLLKLYADCPIMVSVIYVLCKLINEFSTNFLVRNQEGDFAPRGYLIIHVDDF